ncbi:MAG: class I SAM-dependent methyltransferase [Bacteroidota bacterium]|jgi:cyclopropane-fatty-acyl-phospholipid synthase
MSARDATAPQPGTRAPLAARLVMRLLERLAHGTLEVALPDGVTRRFGHGAPSARIEVADWGLFSAVLRRGDTGFAERWMDGGWCTPDLPQLLALCVANRDALDRAIDGSFWGRVAGRLRQLADANTRRGSRRNIAAHYDLGNDFYALWLDRSMTYSAARFDGDHSRTLEAAQACKLERVLERLAPRPGARVLEIGCGWGSFAELAARDFGCRVTALTLSRAQAEYASDRVRAAGLGDRVTVALRDYRDERASYDHVVSIEMFEAVGERYWPAYFAAIARALPPGGTAVVQTITIADRLFERYRSGTDFIRQYVFPGGMLPSPARFRAAAAAAGLEIRDEQAFGADYAETLRRWRHAFLAELPAVRALGCDERFVRMWEFYLAYCQAAFATQCTDVIQFELSPRAR